MRKLTLAAVALMLVLGSGRTVDAALLTFTDENDFLTAAGAATMESFESLSPIPGTTEPISTDHFEITLTRLSPVAVMNIEEGYDNGLHPTDGNRYFAAGALAVGNGACILDFSFSTPITSFGMNVTDFGDTGHSPGSLRLSVGGSEFTVASVPPDLADGNELFFGLVDQDNPFSLVTLTKETTGDRLGIDEVYFGTISNVPEPSAMLVFIGLTTLLIGGRLWRLRKGGL